MNLTMREVFDRYGPTIAVVVVLAALVLLMPGADDGGTQQASTTGAVTGAGTGATAGGSSATGAAAVSGAGGTAAGGATTAGGPSAASGGGGSTGAAGGPITATETFAPAAEGASTTWGPEHGPGNYPAPGPETPCREDGAMPDFSFYSPICVPKFEGDNGGATAQGVTADEVLMVRYRPQEDPATTATLQAINAADDAATVDRASKAFVRFYNLHSETYGREVKLVTFDGTGDPASDEVNRADAVTIATELKPFVVVHVTASASSIFAQELAARGVICICTTSNGRSFYQGNAPYTYTILPILEEYYESMAEFWAKRLNGKPAKYAGQNVRVSNDTRKFGLIYLEGAGDVIDPRAKEGKEHFDRLLAEYGVRLEKAVSYTFDIQQQQQQSTNIIGQMISAGVNHIACVCDPLYPIFLTSEATRQGYFPEWFITGTGLTDTTFFGRTYDQQQWSNAFGMSPLWVFSERKEESSGYRTYKHVEDGFEGNGINVWQPMFQLSAAGIHYAGPNLTPETFQQALIAAPARGGRINAPLVKFTAENPSALKDWVEVWWDANSSGADELNQEGNGILQKANGGARYTLGNWPVADPFAFEDDPAPTFRTTEPETFDHDADGHTHAPEERCRSCG